MIIALIEFYNYGNRARIKCQFNDNASLDEFIRFFDSPEVTAELITWEYA